MANTRGGMIIYGVQDRTCEPVGINPGDVNTEQYAQWVRKRRRARRRPALVRGEADRYTASRHSCCARHLPAARRPAQAAPPARRAPSAAL